MGQTSVKWLIEQLYNHEYHIDVLDVATINGYFDKAKEMHRQEIIDAHISGYDSSGGSAENYYNFYYGSKGSDDTSFQTELSKLAKNTSFDNISDEEIENVAWEKYTGDSAKLGFIEGVKWYREQLKNK
jgi:hypothetical protein